MDLEKHTPRTDVPSDTERGASALRRLRRRRAAERRAQAEPADFGDVRVELRVGKVESLRGQMWRWSQHPVGCRVVQEVLELGTREAAELAQELQNHVMEAVVCPHANYVIQKVVSHLSSASSAFVARELAGNAIRCAKHRFACRILCRLLEFCPVSTTAPLVDELLEDLASLCTHNFAHHVIESILENGDRSRKRLVAEQLLSEPWKYATHKNSSYIIEKALRHCDPLDADGLTRALGQPELILDLAKAQFGCYVARALLQEGKVDTEAALRVIQLHQWQLEGSKHGERFLEDVGLRTA